MLPFARFEEAAADCLESMYTTTDVHARSV